MTETKLEPCPFCGGLAEIQSHTKYHHVGCQACDMWAVFVKENALRAWNRRASPLHEVEND